MEQRQQRGLAELEALQLAYELSAPEPDRAAALLSLITMHFPSVEIGEQVSWWKEIEGELYLVLNLGRTTFSRHGDDLHVAEPVEGGRLVCRAIRPDGSYDDTEADNPYSAEVAGLN
jgi:hypothetical protein